MSQRGSTLGQLLLPALCAILISIGVVGGVSAQPGLVETRVHGDINLGYLAASDVYKYLADVGVTFDFASFNGASIFFNGGILTLVRTGGGESFQPDRYRGTLEPGIRWDRGKHSYSFFVKHQSFHDIDRYDSLDESYEIYGLSYTRADPWNFTISAGTYQNTQDVDYKWDFLASVDTGCIGTCSGKPLYFAGNLHYVTEDGSLPNRDGFLDFDAEVGIESPANVRYFLAYRQVHDINQFNGVTDHQALIGIRYKW